MFNQHSLKKYFANTAWMGLGRFFGMGVGLLLNIVLARHLGRENFGLLNYAQSFAGLFMLFSALGLDSIVVRDLVNQPDQRDRLLGTVFAMRVLGAVVLLASLGVLLPLTEHGQTVNLMILIIACGGLLQAFNVIDFYFQSEVLSRYVVYAQMIAAVVCLLLALLMISLGMELVWFATLLLLSSFVTSGGLLFFYHAQKLQLFSWRFELDLAKRLAQEAWPLVFSMAVVSVYIHVDRIMIQSMLGAEATGEYSAAARLSEGWYFVPTVIVASVFPAVVEARQRDKKHYYKRIQNLYDLMFWLAVTVAIPVSFFSDTIINLLYGQSYAAAAPVLMIHIWAGVFVFLGVASGRWLIVEGLGRHYLFRSLLATALNVLLNYLLIPILGILGAAFATLIAQFFVVFVFDALAPDTRISFKMKCRTLLPVHWWHNEVKPSRYRA